MTIENEFGSRALLVYAVALLAAYALTGVVWGATGGVIGGLTVLHNQQLQQKFNEFAKTKGLAKPSSSADARRAFESLSPQDREKVTKMLKDAMSGVSWFAVTLCVSAVVYGLVGLVAGFFARAWRLAGALPVLALLWNNPVVHFMFAKDLPLAQKAVVVIAQVAVCWWAARWGARFGINLKLSATSDAC